MSVLIKILRRAKAMLRKSILLLLLLTSTVDILFASSPIREEFGIANYSSQILVVYKEFWNEPEDNWWKQSINGFELIFIDDYFHRTNITLRPRFPEGIYGNSYTIISCFPPDAGIYYPDRDPYKEMADIPVMDKLRSIYKTLTIGTVDDPSLFTLENMEEKIVRKQMPRVSRYTLTIRDEDLIRADSATVGTAATVQEVRDAAAGVDVEEGLKLSVAGNILTGVASSPLASLTSFSSQLYDQGQKLISEGQAKITQGVQEITIGIVLSGKTLTDKGSLDNYTSPTKGFDAALSDFTAIKPSNVDVRQTPNGTTIIGTLADGATINVRDHSSSASENAPTLEIRYGAHNAIKIRY